MLFSVTKKWFLQANNCNPDLMWSVETIKFIGYLASFKS